MTVLDFILKPRHGHKVSFDKLPAPHSTGAQEQAPATAAAAAAAAAAEGEGTQGLASSGPAGDESPPVPSSSSSSSTFPSRSSSEQAHGSHAGETPPERKLKSDLRRLMRAAVSFRDLNISVHDASTSSLVHLAGDATAAGSAVLAASRQRVEVEQKKLAIIMVGLPGRGKTFVCNKLKCYLNWLGHPTEHINVGAYRRKIKDQDSIQTAAFFDRNNKAGLAERERAFQLALADMLSYLRSDAGQVAIFDATNSTQERREKLCAALRGSGIRFIFIENICNDPEILQTNYRNKMMYSPDYQGVPTQKAVSDFMERIAKYEEVYEPITDRNMHYIKLTDMVTGHGYIDINRISGYLPGKIVFYLMQVCKSGMTNTRKIWLTRHGESAYNQQALIGGDSPLSSNGQAYAEMLPDVILSRLPKGPDGTPVPVSVWTSTLQRTILTAAGLPFAKLKWKALDEIDAGICDGMTYAQIAEKYPAEFEARKKDKLRYRYPRGESYLDLVQRLEPVISEMEREGESIVIVSHQAVLRVIFGYLMAQPQQCIPSISIPLHTVIELTPRPDGTMGVEYIPVPVHLSDEAMLTTSMDALPASAAAAVAAAVVAGQRGSGSGGSGRISASGSAGAPCYPTSPISPAAVGLDPALAATMGACPFRQDEQAGSDVAAAAAAPPLQLGPRHSSSAAAVDAAVLIGEGGSNASAHASSGDHHHNSSSSMSTATDGGGAACSQGSGGAAVDSPWCFSHLVAGEGEKSDQLSDLPLLALDEIQRMSSCSSRSSMAFMDKALVSGSLPLQQSQPQQQQPSGASTAAAPAGPQAAVPGPPQQLLGTAAN